jgi:gamma-glutamylcyclotransferase (GGCT)/AIG2-like uncharacterized protein YtfP
MRASEFLIEAGAAPIYYFAYGMLTDPKVMKGADFVGMAELKNFEFEMFAYANVRPDPGSVVYGVLWSIDRQMLSQLDITEDYPRLYDRKTVPVFVDGHRVEAFVYTMTHQTRAELEDTYPRKSYVMRLARGYQAGGVPIRQLQTSLSEATDPKFVGFMNTSLGDRVDTPGPDPLADAPDWYRDAPVHAFDTDSSWGRALFWGVGILQKLTPQQKVQLVQLGEIGVEDWLERLAVKQGMAADYSHRRPETDQDDDDEDDDRYQFALEDIGECQDYLEEVFHDPSITSWLDLIKSELQQNKGI